MESSQRPGWLLKLVGITALSMAACSHVVSIATDEFSTTEGTITASYVSPTSGLDKPIVLDELGNQCIESRHTDLHSRLVQIQSGWDHLPP